MKTYVKYPQSDGTFLIVEIEEDEKAQGMAPVGRMPKSIDELPEVVGETIESALAGMKKTFEVVLNEARSFSVVPNEVELEFGIKLNAHLGAVVAAAGVDSNFHIKVKWKREQLSPPRTE